MQIIMQQKDRSAEIYSSLIMEPIVNLQQYIGRKKLGSFLKQNCSILITAVVISQKLEDKFILF